MSLHRKRGRGKDHNHGEYRLWTGGPGKKAVLVDTDIGLRNLDVVMGLENRIVYNLVDVIEGNCRMKQALIKDKKFPSQLFLLPSAQTRDKSSVTPEQMKKLCEDLKEEFDYILLTVPPALSRGLKTPWPAPPARWWLPRRRYLPSATRTGSSVCWNRTACGNIQLIINRLRMDMVKRGDMMSVDDVVDILAVDLIGAVPDDENIVIATNQGEPLAGDSSLAGQAYLNICKRILGEEVPLLDLTEKKGFFRRLFANHRR